MTLRELFWDKNNWVKGTCAAIRENGHIIDSAAGIEEGNCFCLLGGVMKLYPLEEKQLTIGKLWNSIEKLFPKKARYLAIELETTTRITKFNDSSTYEDIMAVVEDANV